MNGGDRALTSPRGAASLPANGLRRWRLLCAAYFGMALVIVALADHGKLPVSFLWPYDALVHFGVLGVAAWLLHRALDRRRWGRFVPVGPALVALVAILEETSQLAIPVRAFSLRDMGANLAGVATAFALDQLWLRLRARSSVSR